MSASMTPYLDLLNALKTCLENRGPDAVLTAVWAEMFTWGANDSTLMALSAARQHTLEGL